MIIADCGPIVTCLVFFPNLLLNPYCPINFSLYETCTKSDRTPVNSNRVRVSGGLLYFQE